MRVPLSWLKEYVNITLSVAELAEKLTVAGLEVEHIEYIGLPGGDDPDRLVWDRQKLVVGQILQVEQHPDADRLVLATVAYGADQPEVVVTGAPNLFEFVGRGPVGGLYAPFALEGAVVYDGHQPGRVKMTLKGRKLRGIYNRCMVCSEKELGLSEEHEGIMLLEGNYLPGTPLQEVLGDVVLEISILPNMARCASVLGVARELAALTGQKVRPPSLELSQSGPNIDGKVVISTTRPDINPRFTAMLIEGVEQKPSPQWLRRRLVLAGQRPINVVVDISNYVMLEMGQPNHTFDYDYLRRRADQYNPDGPIQIITRLPQPGETLTTLDNVSRELPPQTILVTDPAGALGLGGIMGGQDSEITPSTLNVLLEAAAWNFINIRRSMDTLKMKTEASFRFSRGVHPSQAWVGAMRAAGLLQQLAGGTVAQGLVDYYPNPASTTTILLTTAEVRRISGVDLSQSQVVALLRAAEFEVNEQENGLQITVPDYRMDIEGQHDLIEEICRLYGYENIAGRALSDELPPQRGNLELEREERLKDVLVQLGLQEIITYRLTTPERESRILPGRDIAPDDRPYVTLANPIVVDRVAMRHSLLASALEVLATNIRNQTKVGLFEVGQVYLQSEEGILPDELRRLSLVLTGARQMAFWAEAQDAPAGYDFFDLKGLVENLLTALHVDNWHFEAGQQPTFRPGRTARLMLEDKQLGYLGEIHPLVAQAFDLESDHPILAAELDLELLLKGIPNRHKIRPVPSYPAILEDIAIVVDKSVPAAHIEAAIRQAGGGLLRDVQLFDVYEGQPIPAWQKSLAYHLTFQSDNKTLTDKEAKKNRQRIIQHLERQHNAKLRQ